MNEQRAANIAKGILAFETSKGAQQKLMGLRRYVDTMSVFKIRATHLALRRAARTLAKYFLSERKALERQKAFLRMQRESISKRGVAARELALHGRAVRAEQEVARILPILQATQLENAELKARRDAMRTGAQHFARDLAKALHRTTAF